MLTKNDIKITGFLLEKPKEKFSIREIARQIGIDYKLVYTSVKRLVDKYLIKKTRYGKTELCEINLKDAVDYLIQVENFRAKVFLEKNLGIKLIIKEIKEKIKNPYYSLILFGSYAKGEAHKRSDLDLLLIVPNKGFTEKTEREINAVLKIKPIIIHCLIITAEDFKEMLTAKEELNVAKEVFKNHLIFQGIEPYYQMLNTLYYD